MYSGSTGAHISVDDLSKDPIRDVTRTLHGSLAEFFSLSDDLQKYKNNKDPDLMDGIELKTEWLTDSILESSEEQYRGSIDLFYESEYEFSDVVLNIIIKTAGTKDYKGFSNFIFTNWYEKCKYVGKYKRSKLLSREQFVNILVDFLKSAEQFYDPDTQQMKRFDFHFGNVGFRNRSNNMIVFDP